MQGRKQACGILDPVSVKRNKELDLNLQKSQVVVVFAFFIYLNEGD